MYAYGMYGMVRYGMVLCCPASSSTSISWVERDRTHGFCGRQKVKPFPMLTCQETSLCYLACKNWKKLPENHWFVVIGHDCEWEFRSLPGLSVSTLTCSKGGEMGRRKPQWVKHELWLALCCECRIELTLICRTQLLQWHDMMKDRCQEVSSTQEEHCRFQRILWIKATKPNCDYLVAHTSTSKQQR